MEKKRAKYISKIGRAGTNFHEAMLLTGDINAVMDRMDRLVMSQYKCACDTMDKNEGVVYDLVTGTLDRVCASTPSCRGEL